MMIPGGYPPKSDSVTQWLSLFPTPYKGCFLLTDCKYIDYILYINIYIYNISTIKRVEYTGRNKLSHWVTESLFDADGYPA